MKNILKLAWLFILFTGIASPAIAQNNIVGKWIDANDGDTGIFIFDKEGFATVIINGEQMGGRSFKMQAVTACMKYEILPNGSTTQKLNLYIKTTTPDSTILSAIACLIEFVTPNKIKFAANFEEEAIGEVSPAKMDALRPKDTNDPDETTTMVRVK